MIAAEEREIHNKLRARTTNLLRKIFALQELSLFFKQAINHIFS